MMTLMRAYSYSMGHLHIGIVISCFSWLVGFLFIVAIAMFWLNFKACPVELSDVRLTLLAISWMDLSIFFESLFFYSSLHSHCYNSQIYQQLSGR